jgi:hypothetical protein
MENRGLRRIRGNGDGGKAGWSEPQKTTRKRTERQEKDRHKEAQKDTKRNLVFQFSWLFVPLCGNPFSVFSPLRVVRVVRGSPLSGLSSQSVFCDSLCLFVAILFFFRVFRVFRGSLRPIFRGMSAGALGWGSRPSLDIQGSIVAARLCFTADPLFHSEQRRTRRPHGRYSYAPKSGAAPANGSPI